MDYKLTGLNSEPVEQLLHGIAKHTGFIFRLHYFETKDFLNMPHPLLLRGIFKSDESFMVTYNTKTLFEPHLLTKKRGGLMVKAFVFQSVVLGLISLSSHTENFRSSFYSFPS